MASRTDGPCGPLHVTGTGPPPTITECGQHVGPGYLDLYFYQGDDERRTIRWLTSDGSPAADLTDAAISMQIRRGDADTNPDVICEVSVDDGVTITDPTAAVFEVVFSSAKTVLLTGSEPFAYDLQVTPVGGDRKTILRGLVYYDLERTR